MRLSAIKLAGFKSFVDPTVLRLSGNLTGVVGPNGCGKSNIIDAVRWVLGESSARQLRGAALEDVIFNGAKGRKPVGRAVIELVFDNSEGLLGGQYARYTEISVRREIVRDGGSHYYLNGTRCRRRDVVDIFLGTGLGSRSSYAIIEQGTISRIIEARPEEMRLLIEEAAGISKYKEKRRETEHHIRHTRENLDRVSDLRSELEHQLEHLRQQATNAEKYKEYRKEERLLKVQLLALKYRDLHREGAQQRQALQQAVERSEQARDRVLAIEAEVQRLHEHQQAAAQALQEHQATFYSVESEVARTDQALAHARDMKSLRERDLSVVQDERRRVDERLREAMARRDALQDKLAAMTAELDAAADGEARQSRALADAEDEASAAEAAWEHFTAEAETPLRQAEAQRARAQGLDQHRQALAARLDRLQREYAELDLEAAVEALERLDEELHALDGARHSAEAESERVSSRVDHTYQARAQAEDERHQVREALEQARGRLASLEALQAAALQADAEAVSGWLAARGWTDAPTLAQSLNVEPGWEAAVEAALGDFLRARCVDASLHQGLDETDWPQGELMLLQTGQGGTAGGANTPPHAARLADKVRDAASWPAPLAEVYAVETLPQALALAGELRAHERVVTRDGVVVGRGWLHRPRPDDASAGVLERERSLHRERQEQASLERRLQALDQRLQELESAAQSDRVALEAARTALQRARDEHGERLAAYRAQAVREEQAREREQRLRREIDDLQAQLDESGDEWSTVQARLETLEQEARHLGERRHGLQQAVQHRRSQVREARQALDGQRQRLQKLQVDKAGHSSELQAARQSCAELERRLTELEQRARELELEVQQASTPIDALYAERDAAAGRRDQAREQLRAARERQASADEAAREAGQRLKEAENALEEARQRMEQLRVDHQGQSVRQETLAEQVREGGFDLDAVLEALPASATVSDWEMRLERLGRRIQRLGDINLAAIQEYEEQAERAQYLQQQDSDLRTALETLESAIRKIDRETRSRFRDTFDRVEAGFRSFFPRLFGGGEAYLELSGDDLLEAGVRVMARPPGKRNSSIQLLSGGEKALTAVALVFSLFELNPAPFCMLDEVDAPLDDANVGRFCELVRTMSERVQFILITHNKVTMELAEQLHGVTMQEPGVSRLVSVDVQRALELAEA